jgi:hypothetical protein
VTVAALTERLRAGGGMIKVCVCVLLVLWSVAAGLTCLRAAFIAAQVRDRSGVIQARILSLLAPLTLVAFAWWTNSVVEGRHGSRPELIGWTVAACVVAGWSGVFFQRFRAGRAATSVVAGARGMMMIDQLRAR